MEDAADEIVAAFPLTEPVEVYVRGWLEEGTAAARAALIGVAVTRGGAARPIVLADGIPQVLDVDEDIADTIRPWWRRAS